MLFFVTIASMYTSYCSGPQCNETSIRLQGGVSPKEGRIEVCLRGGWGTVCDDYWDTDDARVACRQLALLNSFPRKNIPLHELEWYCSPSKSTMEGIVLWVNANL